MKPISAWEMHRVRMRERVVQRNREREARAQARVEETREIRRHNQVAPYTTPFDDMPESVWQRMLSSLRIKL